MLKEEIGELTHYFDKIMVGVIELTGKLKVGDNISIEKDGESFEQKVDSMQMDKKPVKEAKNGQAIGLKLSQHAKKILYRKTFEKQQRNL